MGKETQAESNRQQTSTTASVTARDLIIDRLHQSARWSLDTRGVPARFAMKTWPHVVGLQKERNEAERAITAGQSVTLTGKAGSGKTLLAVCLIRTWLMTAVEHLIPVDEAYWGDQYDRVTDIGWVDDWIISQGEKILPKFVSACEFFLDLKASFGREETERDIIGKLSKSKALLVLDDLGAEKVSDWSRQVLFTLIDRRYRDCQPIVVTSNLSLQELARHYDDRIASRLVEMGAIINLKADDYRLKKARKLND